MTDWFSYASFLFFLTCSDPGLQEPQILKGHILHFLSTSRLVSGHNYDDVVLGFDTQRTSSAKSSRISARYNVFWSTLAILNSNYTFKILLSVIRCSFMKYSLSHKGIFCSFTLCFADQESCKKSMAFGDSISFLNSPFFYILVQVSLKSVTVILSGLKQPLWIGIIHLLIYRRYKTLLVRLSK